jgi:hypothetical protein
MNFNNLNQQEINDYFLEACTRGDVNIIKQLYKSYRPNHSSFTNSKVRRIHNSFLNLFPSNSPALQIHYNDDVGIKKACEYGHINVVKFIISLQEFSSSNKVNGIDYREKINRTLTECIEICLSNSRYDIANLILPLTEQNVYFEFTMQHNFLKACLIGEFNNVRYLLTSPHLDKYKSSWLNGVQHEFGSSHQGFIYACENGHLKIVEYLTSSYELKEHVDINLVDRKIRIKSEDVLRYLVSKFKLEEDHPFVSKIDFYPQTKLNYLLEENRKEELRKLKRYV